MYRWAIFILLSSRQKIAGLSLAAVGVTIKAGYIEHLQFLLLPDHIASAPLLLIVLGVIIFTVSFFGCCGAVKESRCLLITVSFRNDCPVFIFKYNFFFRECFHFVDVASTYWKRSIFTTESRVNWWNAPSLLQFTVLLGLLLVLEICAVVTAYVLRDGIEDQIESRMSQSLMAYQFDNASQDVSTVSWDQVQEKVRQLTSRSSHDLSQLMIHKSQPWNIWSWRLLIFFVLYWLLLSLGDNSNPYFCSQTVQLT